MLPRPCSNVGLSLLVLMSICALLGGCRSTPDPVPYARAYPTALDQSQVMDVQVFRDGPKIKFTNTTALQFGACTLWLNQRFSKPLPGLAVGQTLEMPLADFRDEFSYPFKGGGFFAVDAPDKLILAQIEAPGKDGKPTLYGLVVLASQDR